MHIYDAYRADLQTQTDFTLKIKRWKAKRKLYPIDQVKPSHLCETLELVNTNLYPKYLSYFEKFADNVTFYSNSQNILQCFEMCKDIFMRHNGLKPL